MRFLLDKKIKKTKHFVRKYLTRMYHSSFNKISVSLKDRLQCRSTIPLKLQYSSLFYGEIWTNCRFKRGLGKKRGGGVFEVGLITQSTLCPLYFYDVSYLPRLLLINLAGSITDYNQHANLYAIIINRGNHSFSHSSDLPPVFL